MDPEPNLIDLLGEQWYEVSRQEASRRASCEFSSWKVYLVNDAYPDCVICETHSTHPNRFRFSLFMRKKYYSIHNSDSLSHIKRYAETYHE